MAAGCIRVFIAQIHKSARVVIAALAKASHGYLAIIVAAKTETLPINGASIAVTFHVITHTFYCIRSRSFRPPSRANSFQQKIRRVLLVVAGDFYLYLLIVVRKPN